MTQTEPTLQNLPVYEELITFLIEENPERFANFQLTDKVRERVWDLVHREKTEGLSAKEKSELDMYAQLEHILRLAKAKARLQIAQQNKSVE
jgi:hypothetical protein